MTLNHIGVDLSKDALELCDPLRGERRIANEPVAIADWIAGLGPEDFIVYEATSGCDEALRLALDAAGQPGARINPLHAWHFARSLNRAKTTGSTPRPSRFGARRPGLAPLAGKSTLSRLEDDDVVGAERSEPRLDLVAPVRDPPLATPGIADVEEVLREIDADMVPCHPDVLSMSSGFLAHATVQAWPDENRWWPHPGDGLCKVPRV